MTITASSWSHDQDLGASQLACIYGHHSILQSYDCHLEASQLTSDKINGEASGKITSCSHVISHLMTMGDLLNNCSGINIISQVWLYDVSLNDMLPSNGTASPSCGHLYKDYL